VNSPFYPTIGDTMHPDIESFRVWLGYSPAQGDLIFEYLDRHRTENGGRYRLEPYPWFNDGEYDPERFIAFVYTHPWLPATKDESDIICSFDFNTTWPGIDRILVPPTVDWDAAWAELAVLEEVAIGEMIHGRKLCGRVRRKITLGAPAGEEESPAILAAYRRPQPTARLRYSARDFDGLLTYLKHHCWPFHGRFMLPPAIRDDPEIDLEIVEVTVCDGQTYEEKRWGRPVCDLRLHCGKRELDCLAPAPNVAPETAWAEVALLEQEALGKTVHGVLPAPKQEESHGA
jgi:hypothetical protein